MFLIFDLNHIIPDYNFRGLFPQWIVIFFLRSRHKAQKIYPWWVRVRLVGILKVQKNFQKTVVSLYPMKPTVYLTSFVGREEDLRTTRKLLAEKRTRLLTLQGPGGIGKTRLAVELIQDLDVEFEDGVVWVSLEGFQETDRVAQQLANELRILPTAAQDLAQCLSSHLLNREVLIILDNCEHLLAACSDLVAHLLKNCPDVYILATSREPLGIADETLWPVPTLAYPDGPLISQALGNEALVNLYPALALFVARAKQANPAFSVTTTHIPDLVRINQMLEGLPLAIELAAAWSNVLEIPEILTHLGKQLDLLVRRGPGPNLRQRSLRETIRWSYRLLTQGEQILFRRLAVFNGSFSIEAIAGVCRNAPLAKDNLLLLVGSLLDKSLITKDLSKEGQTYFRLMDTVRQFAQEELARAGDETNQKQAHFRYFSNLVREAAPQLTGAEQRKWIAWLDVTYENLQAALAYGVDLARSIRQEPDRAEMVEMVNGLYWLWDSTTRYREGIEWYRKVYELPLPARLSEVDADLVRNLATLTWLSGDYMAATQALGRSLQIAEPIRYEYGVAHAKLLLGIMNLHQGNIDQAKTYLNESEAGFRVLGESRGLTIALVNLGGLLLEMESFDNARIHIEEGLSLARHQGDIWGEALAISGLGDLEFRVGQKNHGLRLIDEALSLFQQLGQKWLMAEATWRAADMRRALGQLEKARAQFESGYVVAQEAGAFQWALSCLEGLALISLEKGNISEALGFFAEILRANPGSEYRAFILRAILQVVKTACLKSLWEQAAMLWGIYLALGDSGMPENFLAAEVMDMLHPHLITSQAAEWVVTGKKLTLGQAARLVHEIAANYERSEQAAQTSYALRLLALGPAEVYLNDRMLIPADWTFAKPKELLFYLALNPPVTKEQLGLVFWPDASPAQLRASLRAALYQLRRALGRRDWVLYQGGRYSLNRQLNYWVDVEAFEDAIQEAQKALSNQPKTAARGLEYALALYRGDFLEGIANDEWGVLRRETLKHQYLDGMIQLGRFYLEKSQPEMALGVYRKLLDQDRLFEEAHRGLMRAYAAAGKRDFAVEHYHQMARTLRTQLGIEPAEETQNLLRELQQDKLGRSR